MLSESQLCDLKYFFLATSIRCCYQMTNWKSDSAAAEKKKNVNNVQLLSKSSCLPLVGFPNHYSTLLTTTLYGVDGLL